MTDSNRTLTPETVLDVRPRYVVFMVPRSPDQWEVDEITYYYIGPYPRPLANYIRVRMRHWREIWHACEREWGPSNHWGVFNTKKVKNRFTPYHTPYPMQGIQLHLSTSVIGYWQRVCYLLGIEGVAERSPLEDEGQWKYLRYYKGGLPHHLGPYPVPILKAIRKYLEVLDIQSLDTTSDIERDTISNCIYRNPQLGSTLDTSVTYEMVQEFSRERLLMYQRLYELTIPFMER